MFRSLQRTVLIRPFPIRPAYRGFSFTSRVLADKKGPDSNSVTKQLYEAVKSNNPSNQQTPIDDSLLDMLNNLESRPTHQNSFYDSFGLTDASQVHPRDIAKNIRITGPSAGKTLDINNGALWRGLGAMNSILKNNKVKYLVKIQKRHIRKAKYRKQKKREWWRQRFSQGFGELLAKVNDAKRRGY
ncbi:hypothetical protein PSN45_002607 [Yamadazyma tenuis]|uniref:Ribosomal protein S21 n=1 Tax=Candida tenuis (strain ATCC 10573 / BCRC 21748 / CBS 615 / JCM 9827 / NBRC 10315 / NRRL Y-1498 / VKM Y-70) TaxID=590646 RepID=G3AZV4_CANTC|nr:uncharacterized protein CANTEDRAFT_112988 [Yamadazyma tenuis ATCC 10573]EGV65248.1 hypothetical protein CANTEDRAFT_112988 [Yamadazyma tenuis ATCC 10573]WEJ95097.1 hypothetical protein PSN45_002607 [Yamadazyma tenuis]